MHHAFAMKLSSPNTCNELLLWDQNLKIKTFFVTKVKKMHFSNLVSPAFLLSYLFFVKCCLNYGDLLVYSSSRKNEKEGIVLPREHRWRVIVYKPIINRIISNGFLCFCVYAEIIL